MAAVATITYVDATGPVIRVGFNIALAGTYPTGGDPVNLAIAAADPLYVGMVPDIIALGAPIDVDMWDSGGDVAHTFWPILAGVTNQTPKLKIATSNNQTELANNTAYAGNTIVTVGKIIGEAVFAKL
jgi:hypothetical protein